MSATGSRPRILLLYVCDFSSVHARTYIEYFAERQDAYDVTVISTRSAPPMHKVRLITLNPVAMSDRVRTGHLGTLSYQLVVWMPKLYEQLRLREDVTRVRRNLAPIRSLAGELTPDILHGFRAAPEGVLALELKRLMPDVPFFLSTWGQDFLVWAGRSAILNTWTRAVIRDVTVLLPDNPRDERLARKDFDLPWHARTHVVPASGGLCVEQIEVLRVSTPPATLDGSPKLLSMRGYQNLYIQVKVLLQAFRMFLHHAPGAHMYIDGPEGHPGEQAVRSWIGRLGLAGRVSLVHLTRAQVFRYMEACDLYVSATLTDGLPISLLEALYFGQFPVVMRHDSTFPPLIDGVNAIGVEELMPTTIAEAWASAIRFLANRAERMAFNRELISANYERNKNLAQVEQLYREAIHIARPGADDGGSPSLRQGTDGQPFTPSAPPPRHRV